MPPSTGGSTDSLTTFDALEVDYAEALAFRRLLVPRLLAITCVVAVVVMAGRLSLQPLAWVTAFDAVSVGVALWVEQRARRRYIAHASGTRERLGLRVRTDSPPTAR